MFINRLVIKQVRHCGNGLLKIKLKARYLFTSSHRKFHVSIMCLISAADFFLWVHILPLCYAQSCIEPVHFTSHYSDYTNGLLQDHGVPAC